jgi:hypothetical protein
MIAVRKFEHRGVVPHNMGIFLKFAIDPVQILENASIK